MSSDCLKLKFLGLFLMVVFIIGILSNSLLLWIFNEKKKLRKPLDILIIALTINNFFGCIIELPPLIISNFYCKWIFQPYQCELSAFAMFFVASFNIYLIVVISLERFYIVYKPLEVNERSLKPIYVAIGICFFLALFWASLPLFGWSHYTFEGLGTSCCVEWSEKSFNVQTYNISILVFIFILPLMSIVITTFLSIHMIGRLNDAAKSILNEASLKNRLKIERDLTFTAANFIGMFLLSWLPYAFGSIYQIMSVSNKLSPFLTTLSAIYAKTFVMWTSLFYIFFNKKIKKTLMEKLRIKEKMPLLSLSHSKIRTTTTDSG